jgi:hypothetical protein
MDSQPRSREALSEFLEYLAGKGLMERNTVQARKAAVSKMLGILDQDQASDVTNLDLDDIVARFQRLHGRNYTPGSLNSYKSRLKSALDDFRSYLNNPLGFRPGVQPRARAGSKSASDGQPESSRSERRAEGVRQIAAPAAAVNVLPIPIRPDLTIHIQGLPYDLTEAEARKIAAVVTAMVQT